jgi:hypothetical protein
VKVELRETHHESRQLMGLAKIGQPTFIEKSFCLTAARKPQSGDS